MRTVIVITWIVFAGSSSAQTPPQTPGKPLGIWHVEYVRTITRMHGEPTTFTERGRMTLRAVGDSIFGEFRVGDSTSTDLSALRGIARKNVYTLYVEEPPPKGMGVFFSALGVAMDWLRETVHGVAPVVIRFEVVARGDSLTGARFVSGGLGRPDNSRVLGIRAKP